ncbi:MAG: hypothetical protein HYW48_01775 [Deltaproteobacteria bacterium]|nr:hypothetical protein [Deltaproteobacteria bacterium]
MKAVLFAFLLLQWFGCRSSEKDSELKEHVDQKEESPQKAPDPLNRETSVIVKNDCEERVGYRWIENQCLLWVEYECKQRGWLFENGTCISPSETDCRKRQGWLWINEQCILKDEKDCLQQAMVWTGDTCVSSEEADCRRNSEKVWEQGECRLAVQVACLKEGNFWKDDRCLDKQVAECEARLIKHVWLQDSCISLQKYTCELDGNMTWHDDKCISRLQAQCEIEGKVWLDPECVTKNEVARRESEVRNKETCVNRADSFEGKKVFVWSDTKKLCLANPELAECFSIYKRTNLLSEAKNVRREVWETENSQVVKEVPWSQAQLEILDKQVQLYERASNAGVSPNILSHGICRQDEVPLLFALLPKLQVVSVETADSESFKKSVRSLVNDLHKKARIIHGDIHLNNFLYSPVDDHYFIFDFDNSIDLDLISDDKKAGHIGFEDYKLALFLRGNLYPPGPDVPGYEDSWRERGYEPWQMNIFKYGYFDSDKDGVISTSELDKLADALGKYKTALVMQDLYNWRIADLSEGVKAGFLKDENRRGTGSEPYKSFVQTLKKHWHHPVDRGTRRIVLDSHRYKELPLEGDHILVISGGDFHTQRMFPILAHHLYTKFALDRGYRYSYFTENLAGIDSKNGGKSRVPYWTKIYMILDLLEQPKNRVIVWLDDDGILADHGEPSMIERYLKAYPEKDLIVAWDQEEWALVNTGAMIVRNTNVVRKFFHDVLKVGEENRCWIGLDKKTKQYVETQGTLMTCKQSRNCLHEQQALQELYIPMRRNCDEGSTVWHRASDFPRTVDTDWKQSVAIVPQWEETQSLNMNIFVNGRVGSDMSPGYLAYRSSPQKGSGPSALKPFTSNNPPFFLQCAGIENKHKCIGEVLDYLQILKVADMTKIVQKGMGDAGFDVKADEINDTFGFSERTKVSLNGSQAKLVSDGAFLYQRKKAKEAQTKR